MALRQYFPISVVLFIVVVLTARHFAIPVVPFAVVLLVGETLVGVQLEDNKVARLMGDFFRALKPNPRPH